MNISSHLLKHKNTDVASFSVNRDTWTVGNVEILNDTFSPVNAKGDKYAKSQQLNEWLDNRCIPNSRDGVERLRSVYKIHNLKELMLANYGLSLSDHYWITNPSNVDNWETINFFDNRYSDNLGRIFFDARFRKLENDENTPDSSLNGTLKKRWL